MGYGETLPDDNVCNITRGLIDSSYNIVKPSFYYSIFPCFVNKESINVASCELNTDRTISTLLRKSEIVALFVATAGEEFQEWFNSIKATDDSLKMFIADALGSVIVEATGDFMEEYLQKEILPLKHTNRFSPGYCGWNVIEQKKIFSFLPNDVCGIKLNESSLMYPIKSISGVIGIGRDVLTKKYGCSICKKKDCYLRKK